jgi:hypothetical protein
MLVDKVSRLAPAFVGAPCQGQQGHVRTRSFELRSRSQRHPPVVSAGMDRGSDFEGEFRARRIRVRVTSHTNHYSKNLNDGGASYGACIS